jgi:predicted DNA-binding transcriptional regulator YafY
MGALDYLNRIKNLHTLLQNRFKGTAAELAKKIGVERRTLFNYMEILRNSGAEIHYDKVTGTYYYSNSFSPGW